MPRRVLPLHQRSPEYVTVAALATILLAIVVGFLLGLLVGGLSVSLR